MQWIGSKVQRYGPPNDSGRASTGAATAWSAFRTSASTTGLTRYRGLSILVILSLLSLFFVLRSQTAAQQRLGTSRHSNLYHSESFSNDSFPYYRPLPQSASPNDFDGITAVPFQQWPEGVSLPCVEFHDANRKTPIETGFVYVKNFKVGSSTGSSVQLRISRNEAHRRGQDFFMCDTRFDHQRLGQVHPHRADFLRRAGSSELPHNNSIFTWTVLRDPTKRYISQFFFRVYSRHTSFPKLPAAVANDGSLLSSSFLVSTARRRPGFFYNAYSQMLSRSKVPWSAVLPNALLKNHARRSFENMDFIAITERFDESMVVLSMLLRIPLGDVLYLSSKENGGYRPGHPCRPIYPVNVTARVRHEFSHSDEWQRMVYWDHVMYEAAHRSLDLTIDHLGRAEVEENMQLYQQALAQVRYQCQGFLPCNVDGSFNDRMDCILGTPDQGCGLPCIDEVAKQLNIDTLM